MTVTATPPKGSGPADPPVLEFPAKPRTPLSRRLLTVALLVVLALSVWSVDALDISIETFVRGYNNAVDFLGRTVPFTFPPLDELWMMIGQTLAIVVLATVLGFALSLPIALLAAANTTPHPIVRHAARVAVVLLRAVPDFVIAVFLVRVFGLGTLPGILALGVGSIGMMGKLYADAIEEVDPGPVEALRTAGAGRLQQIVGGVLPQIRPQLVATALHAFDINLRGSVLLGFVGVSGIGMYISAALETMNYPRGMGLTLVLLVLCLLAELVSGLVRRQMLGAKSRTAGTSGPFGRWFAALLPRFTERGWVRGRTAEAAAPEGKAEAASSVSTAASTEAPAGPEAVRTHAADPATTSRAVPGAPLRTRTGALRLSPPWGPGRRMSTGWQIVLGVIIAVSLLGSGIQLGQLAGGLSKGLETLGMYFPPETAGIGDKLLGVMVETVQMGLAGTLLGILIAIPLGLLSASNIVWNRAVNGSVRGVVVTVRAIPDIIVGIAFVVITGLGATAGALALAVGSIGFFAKVIADSLEEVDARVQDAVRTSGATGVQVFFAATLRQVMPALAAHTMHQLDRNIRGATGLGVIGAGGIGFYLNNAQRVLEYGVVTTSVILIVLVVTLSEGLAMWTRREVR